MLENTDAVRHALMIPGLNPLFTLEFAGPTTRTARFVTPDEDITLEFHCHVEAHEKMGMHGRLIVGSGSPVTPVKHAEPMEWHLHEGLGVVVSVEPRRGRVVIDHEEIEGYMAPMVMSFLVKPARLLKGLKTNDKIGFTIDADQRAIVDIVPIP